MVESIHVKNVVCKKCGQSTIIPANLKISSNGPHAVCAKIVNGVLCCGDFKLNKVIKK